MLLPLTLSLICPPQLTPSSLLWMDDSDSSSISEDSVLGSLNDSKPKINPYKSITDPFAEIPSVFLVEGEKNRKLLQQDDEIQTRIVEDQQKVLEKKEALKTLRFEILDELNDNGSDFVFTVKNDGQVIENLIERTQNEDPGLEFERHFYYFRNVTRVKIDICDEDQWYKTLVVNAFQVMQDPKQIVEALDRRKCSLYAFMSAVLVYAVDPSVLNLAREVLKETFGSPALLEKEMKSLEHKESWESKLDVIMSGVGAYSSDNVTLKLVQFNNNVDILVDRLSLVFEYFLKTIPNKECQEKLFRRFVLASSDFHLNKQYRSKLIKRFMIPFFCAFIDKTEAFHHPKIDENVYHLTAELMHDGLSLISVRVSRDKAALTRKAWEIHYTFIQNLLLHRNKLPGEKQTVLDHLCCLFLELPEPLSSLIQQLIPIVNNIGACPFVAGTETAVKNMFCVKLIVSIVSDRLNQWHNYIKKQLYNLHERLLVAKVSIQRSIASPGMATLNNHERQRTSLALSEAYHDLDYLSVVLDKNFVLMRANDFYDS